MGDEELEIEAGAPEVSADEWMARAALFELLSLGLLKPGRPIAEALASGEFAAACAETLGALGLGDAAAAAGVDLADYEGDNAEKIYHEVLREYTRLFVGTREPLITPFAGVRASQAQGQRGLLFVGKESMAVERFMRRCGVAKNLAAGQSNDPAPHRHHVRVREVPLSGERPGCGACRGRTRGTRRFRRLHGRPLRFLCCLVRGAAA